MTRKIMVVMLLLLVSVSSVLAAELVKTRPMPMGPSALTGNEPFPAIAPYYPGNPDIICVSPGTQMGITRYDYQTNGSTGRRLAIDSQGGIHVAWMWSNNYPSIRNARYNCFGPTFPSPWPGEGTNVYSRNGSGYVEIGVRTDDRAVVTFHNAGTNSESLYVATDVFQCQGTFEIRKAPNRLGTSPVNKLLWPYIAIDRTNRYHVVATTSTSSSNVNYTYEPVGYTRSNNGGTTWTALQSVDTTRVITAIIAASKVSDKVAIVYLHPYLNDTTAGRNNVYYIESTDGTTWNFTTGKINVTNYHRNNDSLYAWQEVSAVYDYNDNLHIAWPAWYVSGGINSAPSFYYGRSHVYHWSSNLNTIVGFASFDSTWPNEGCDMGAASFVFSRVSVAVNPFSSQQVWVAYTSWDTSDCSTAGFANGDIYMHQSNDYGMTWAPRVNVTNSQTPLCIAGECDSDHYGTLAEYTYGDSLHLFYLNDKDAGSVVQTEGAVTDNPMLYYAIPVTRSGVDDDIQKPKDFSLSQNYPNPFNARTNIDFELTKAGSVNLSVYDITGAKVATLVNGRMDSGHHQVNWDANGVASGIYFYTLKTNGAEVTRKMTLLK